MEETKFKEDLDRTFLIVGCFIKANNNTLTYGSKFPWIQRFSHQWFEMVDTLRRYKQTLYTQIVRWNLQREGWITCNTDGDNKRNPCQSTYRF